MGILPIVHTLDTVAYRSKDFVGNGVEKVGQAADGQLFAEDFRAVAFVAGYVGNVYHAHIHADVAQIGGLVAVYKAIASAVAQTAVQPVGIAYGQHGYA